MMGFAAVPARDVCGECGCPRRIFARRLCRRCWNDPGVRARHPQLPRGGEPGFARPWLSREVEQLRHLRCRDGWTIAEIAEVLGRTYGQVLGMCLREGFRRGVKSGTRIPAAS